MIQISNRIITEINKDHAYLLKSKFFNDEGDKITGMQILDMILSCIKAHKNKFCYYMDVIDAYPHICDYYEKDVGFGSLPMSWTVSELFKLICWLKLTSTYKGNRARWQLQQTYAIIFSNRLYESKYTKEEAAQNNAVSFVQALFTMPKKAREFAIQEYATRLGNRKGNVHSMYNTNPKSSDDIRISDHWGATFGVPTRGNIVLRGQWAWGKITDETTRSGSLKWDIIDTVSGDYAEANTIAAKTLIIDKVIREIYYVSPKQVALLQSYREKLNKGVDQMMQQNSINQADTDVTNIWGNPANPPELDFPPFTPLCVNGWHNSSYFNMGGYIWQPNSDMYLYLCGV